MKIDPFRALPADDDRYVTHPATGGERLARRMQRGLSPMLLVGHPGLGKSTELLRTLHALRAERLAVYIDLGALPVPVDPKRVLYDIAVETVQWWSQEGPTREPTPFLVQDIRASDPTFPQGQGRFLLPGDLAKAAWDELTGAADLVDSLPLLIDGVDKLEPEVGRAVLRNLLALSERAELAVIGSPSLATGPDNIDILDRYRVVTVTPVDPETDEGLAFLVEVASRHLRAVSGEDGAFPEALLARLARASGGVLRDLLAMVADAWAYADDGVTEGAVDEAVRDRLDRFRRLLVAGDRDALARADATDGLEVPADRKVRLLQHGLLLEYGQGAEARTRPHPLVRQLLG